MSSRTASPAVTVTDLPEGFASVTFLVCGSIFWIFAWIVIASASGMTLLETGLLPCAAAGGAAGSADTATTRAAAAATPGQTVLRFMIVSMACGLARAAFATRVGSRGGRRQCRL